MSEIQKRIEAQKRSIKQTRSYKTFDLHIGLTERFFERMDELKLTQKELAIRAGLKAPYVNRVLNNPANLTLETVVNIAEALELDVKVLLKPKTDTHWVKFSGEVYEALQHVMKTAINEVDEKQMDSIREKVRWELRSERSGSPTSTTREDDVLPIAA